MANDIERLREALIKCRDVLRNSLANKKFHGALYSHAITALHMIDAITALHMIDDALSQPEAAGGGVRDAGAKLAKAVYGVELAALSTPQDTPRVPEDGGDGEIMDDPWAQVGFLKEKLRQTESERDTWKDRALDGRLAATTLKRGDRNAEAELAALKHGGVHE